MNTEPGTTGASTPGSSSAKVRPHSRRRHVLLDPSGIQPANNGLVMNGVSRPAV
jgi:hypothetical protein